MYCSCPRTISPYKYGFSTDDPSDAQLSYRAGLVWTIITCHSTKTENALKSSHKKYTDKEHLKQPKTWPISFHTQPNWRHKLLIGGHEPINSAILRDRLLKNRSSERYKLISNERAAEYGFLAFVPHTKERGRVRSTRHQNTNLKRPKQWRPSTTATESPQENRKESLLRRAIQRRQQG